MRNLVVTGGTKGIGKAIIERFLTTGNFKAFTCSRHEMDLDALKEEVAGEIHTMQADLSKKEEVEAFADFIKAEVGVVDVLVNNTGRFIPGLIIEEDDSVLDEMLNTNLYSAYYLTKRLIDHIQNSAHPMIANIVSTAGIMPYYQRGSYCISKYAMLGMTKVLREELRTKGVKVTAVIPGATLTPSWEGVDIPEEKFMKPEDIAEAVYSAYSMSPNTVVEEILVRPQQGDI